MYALAMVNIKPILPSDQRLFGREADFGGQREQRGGMLLMQQNSIHG